MSTVNRPNNTVTSVSGDANLLLMAPGSLDTTASRRRGADLDQWMVRYQQADPDAARALVLALSPPLLRLFMAHVNNRQDADDLLQDTWLRIHRVRHTFRPGEPALPWVYAIARRVAIDSYRRRKRIDSHECVMEILPDRAAHAESVGTLPEFTTLVAALPQAQREVLMMMKVGGLSLEEVARATSSTVGAVKQKAHRAYDRLRKLLKTDAADRRKGGIDELQSCESVSDQ
jgi:RNA polymerase sigma-70 factor (ECF subfamily)